MTNPDFRTLLTSRQGIVCGKDCLNKGFVSIEECLECAGPKNVRCIPSNLLLLHAVKEGSDYYSRKVGEYHVSDFVSCPAEFLFKNYIGYFYKPKSLWNMIFGTSAHDLFNQYELSNPISEGKLEYVFESEGRKIAAVGSQDGYFPSLSLEMFRDVEERLYNDNFDDNVYDGSGVLQGVLLERKTAAKIDNVFYKPKDIHVLQETAYIALREKEDVNWVMTTYLEKPFGRCVNLIMPVLYYGSEKHKAAGKELLGKSLVVNRAEMKAKIEKRLSTFEHCLTHREFPYRFPNFQVQCTWCDFRDVCKPTPNVPITDTATLEDWIAKWIKTLRVSERFFDDPDASNMKVIAERWPRSDSSGR